MDYLDLAREVLTRRRAEAWIAQYEGNEVNEENEGSPCVHCDEPTAPNNALYCVAHRDRILARFPDLAEVMARVSAQLRVRDARRGSALMASRRGGQPPTQLGMMEGSARADHKELAKLEEYFARQVHLGLRPHTFSVPPHLRSDHICCRRSPVC
jgi:hypothetical protein